MSARSSCEGDEWRVRVVSAQELCQAGWGCQCTVMYSTASRFGAAGKRCSALGHGRLMCEGGQTPSGSRLLRTVLSTLIRDAEGDKMLSCCGLQRVLETSGGGVCRATDADVRCVRPHRRVAATPARRQSGQRLGEECLVSLLLPALGPWEGLQA